MPIQRERASSAGFDSVISDIAMRASLALVALREARRLS
jgi:hypothetical protein